MTIRKRKGIAYFEVFLLVSMSFAIAFLISKEVGVGSALIDETVEHVSSSGLVVPGGVESSTVLKPTLVPSANFGEWSGGPAFNANVIQTEGAKGFGLVNGKAYPVAYENGAWAVRGDVVPASQLPSSITGATFPGATAADYQALGWASKDVYVNGQTVPALVNNGGQGTQAMLLGKDGALTGQQSTYSGTSWSAASGGAGTAGAGGGGGTGAGTGVSGLLSGTAFGTGPGIGGFVSSLASGALWGALVGGLAYFGAGLFGLNPSQQASVGLAAGVGTFAGTTTYFLASNQILGAGAAQYAGLLGLGVGIGVGVAILLLTYKKEKQELVKFECLPWEAPTGGYKCEECNKDPMKPCSEYRCKSLGQACEIVNKGTTNEQCIWKNKEDTQAPTIEFWDEALKPDGLNDIPDKAILPPNRGIKIVKSNGGCLEAYTKLEFGIKTDEPAQCKIDFDANTTYEQMQFLFGGKNEYSREHKDMLRAVNAPASSEQGASAPEIGIGGTFRFYVKCQDANGNKNVAAFGISYCVDKGPDTRPPIIEGTSITDGSPVMFNADKVPIEVYTNEPAECKWSKQDKAFETMENAMSCSTDVHQVNANLQYICSGDLTGVKNREDNNFYFRCMDYSTAGRNVMRQSHSLTLKGTEPLIITKVGPNETFRGGGGTSTFAVNLTVATEHGANEGVAACSFSNVKDDSDSYVEMSESNNFEHNQVLYLGGGNYQYFFRCIDAGGNLAEANTSFNVLVDNSPPLISRVYRDGEKLKIITSEEAKCVYSTTSCNYNIEDASQTALIYKNPTIRTVHVTNWDSSVTYYIKCADYQNNQPFPSSCQIVARGSEY